MTNLNDDTNLLETESIEEGGGGGGEVDSAATANSPNDDTALNETSGSGFYQVDEPNKDSTDLTFELGISPFKANHPDCLNLNRTLESKEIETSDKKVLYIQHTSNNNTI